MRANRASSKGEYSREGSYRGERGREANGETGEIELGYICISAKEPHPDIKGLVSFGEHISKGVSCTVV